MYTATHIKHTHSLSLTHTHMHIHTGKNPEWDALIHKQAKRWKNMITNLVIHRPRTHPLLVVRYEDLKKDTVEQVERMLNFLKMPIDKAELLQRLQQKSFSEFHRNHSTTSHFDLYTPSQIKYWNSVITEVETSLHSNDIVDFIPLRKYVRSHQ